MSIPRRLGRLARCFVSKNIGEDRLRETIRLGRERSETLRDAFGAAWRGAAEEWRAAERHATEQEASRERASEEEASAGRAWERRSDGWRATSPRYTPRKYPSEVLVAYHRLGLNPGDPLDAAHRRRRELVKRHHPDRFVDSEQRARAERLTAEINAAHDVIERYLLKS